MPDLVYLKFKRMFCNRDCFTGGKAMADKHNEESGSVDMCGMDI